MSYDIRKFIKEMQNRPELWDTTSDDYMNRSLKATRWSELADVCGDAEMTPAEKKELGFALQRKWKGLRSCYTRELNRQRNNNVVLERRNEYTHFKQLQFLNRVVKLKGTDDESEQESRKEAIVNLRKRTTKRRKANEQATNIEFDSLPAIEPKLNRLIDSREHHDYDDNDEDRLFLLSLLSTLRDVPRERKIATKIRLMSVLQDAVQGNFNNTIGYGNPQANQSYSSPTKHCSTNSGQSYVNAPSPQVISTDLSSDKSEDQ